MLRELFGGFSSETTQSDNTTQINTKDTIKSYILVCPPQRRTDHPMSEMAIQVEHMDTNISINPNMKPGNWHEVQDKNGKPKVWRKRNYLVGRIDLVNCAELKAKGIDPNLKPGVKGTSTQSGWGEISDLSGNKHRILYVHPINFHLILQNGFFDKTAGVFVKQDR
jgi:hypothetical protein